MPHDEFLKLLQMTEAYRKCEGKACLCIEDADVDRAAALEDGKRSHAAAGCPPDCTPETCPGCEGVRQQKIALRELLHSQGVDLPVDVLED